MLRFKRSPYKILIIGAALSILVVLLDLTVDYLMFYENKTIIDVIARNMTPMAMWSHGVVVTSYMGFSVVVYLLHRAMKDELDAVDGFLYELLDSLKALRFNMASVKMAVHAARYNIEPPTEMLQLIEEGVEKSVGLLDSYLAHPDVLEEHN
jgi:translation elongation factor EF-Tu-like GTPase